MKRKNLALIALASIILSQAVHAGNEFVDSNGEDVIQRIKRTSTTKAIAAPKAEDSYWGWGVSLFNKHRTTIATGLLMATSIGIATYAYFCGDEEVAATPEVTNTYSYSHSNFDFDNLTSEVSLLDSFGNVLMNGVCNLAKSVMDDGSTSYESNCDDFYAQVKSSKF